MRNKYLLIEAREIEVLSEIIFEENFIGYCEENWWMLESVYSFTYISIILSTEVYYKVFVIMILITYMHS